jgi:ketosteroid isomerase-like protein
MPGSALLSSSAAAAGDEQRVLRVAEAWLRAHDTDDPAALTAVLAEDVVVHSLFRTAPARGRDAASTHFRSTMSAFPDLRIEVVAAAASGRASAFLAEVDFVGHFLGRLSRPEGLVDGDGSPFRVRGVVLLTVRGDRVCTVRTLFDKDDWLRQIGLPTQPSPRQSTNPMEKR